MAEKLRRQIRRSCGEKGRGEKRGMSAHELGAGRKGEGPGRREGVSTRVSRLAGTP